MLSRKRNARREKARSCVTAREKVRGFNVRVAKNTIGTLKCA